MIPNVSLQKKLVLIVEDNPELNLLLSTYLKRNNLDVLTCHSGEEAIAAIETKRPDLILCDFIMPKGNGLFVMEYLKSHNIQVPVIFLTGYTGGEITQIKTFANVIEVLAKPAHPRAILNKISENID